ncbi:MAG: hypothetical protein ABIY48_11650 [Acidimicrobiales bacterium]
MGNRTDQDEPRHVGDRVAPATTPDRATIREDRAAVDEAHDADRPPTPEEEVAAEQAGADVDPDVAGSYKDALRRGAAQEGEGKPGL